MSVAKKTTEAENAWLTGRHQLLSQNLNGLKTTRFASLRAEGYEEFLKQGFPTPKDERWKYTNLRPVRGLEFGRGEVQSGVDLAEQVESLKIPDADALQYVFVNGIFQESLSSTSDEVTKGAIVSTIGQVLSEHGESFKILDSYIGKSTGNESEPIVSLNSALMEDGIFVYIEPRSKLDRPVHVIHLSTTQSENAASFPRSVIVAEKGASAVVAETFAGIGDGTYFTNPVTEIFAAEEAVVEHFKIALETDDALHTGKVAVRQAGNSLVSSFVFTISGKLIRNEVDFYLDGSNSDSKLLGLSVLDDQQHVDNHTIIHHAKPSCESFELYKGVYGGKTSGAFCGTIVVEQDAQKTNAIQNNQTLLLSEDAQSNSRPQLKIWADDVKCTHGATVGQLDEDALFYLKSRGIKKNQAQKMLVSAFAHEVVHEAMNESIKGYLDALLDEKLNSFV